MKKKIFRDIFVWKWLAVCAALFLLVPPVLRAETVSLNFSNDTQTIQPNEVVKLTVRLSNPSTETVYFNPSSSSGTGSFSPYSTWKEGSYYISRGDSSKSFYYKDSSLGSFVIKVSPVVGKSGDFAVIEQNIIVSDQATIASSTEDDTSSTSEKSATTNTQTPASSGGGSYSSHSSQTDLSDVQESMPKIGAGRKRLVTTGTPVSFRVEKGRVDSPATRYVWTFGDGSAYEGEKVEHVYQFAGQYNVVLNAYFNQGQSVSRTKIEVVDPRVQVISIDKVSGSVEVVNKDKREVNIGGWPLLEGYDYRFPADTIIDAGQKIKIPVSLIATSTSNIFVMTDIPYSLTPDSLSRNLTKDATSSQIAILEKKILALRGEIENIVINEKYDTYTDKLSTISNRNIGDNSVKNVSNKIVLKPKLSWWQKLIRIGK